MCSTFKTLLVAFVLTRVDAGTEAMDRRVAYGQKDLLDHAPITRAHAGAGTLSIEALCAAAIEYSDNTAANLLLASVGGPSAVTAFVRTLGDETTRVDRIEPAANYPKGDLDTTTPRAMAKSVRAILLGETLSSTTRVQLESWMSASVAGRKRLRASFPADWRAGDKPGTSRAETNDVAIARPPRRSPLNRGSVL